VRSLLVELSGEGVELGLLLEEVGSCRSGCLLFQRQVHSLMTAILLWSPRFDAFDLYTEPEPPDGESGEVVEPVGAGEGHAVVGTDGAWQATLLEQLLEGRKGQVFADRFECLAQEQIA